MDIQAPCINTQRSKSQAAADTYVQRATHQRADHFFPLPSFPFIPATTHFSSLGLIRLSPSSFLSFPALLMPYTHLEPTTSLSLVLSLPRTVFKSPFSIHASSRTSHSRLASPLHVVLTPFGQTEDLFFPSLTFITVSFPFLASSLQAHNKTLPLPSSLYLSSLLIVSYLFPFLLSLTDTLPLVNPSVIQAYPVSSLSFFPLSFFSPELRLSLQLILSSFLKSETP